MSTDKAREVLEKHKEWVLKFNHGMATAESKALEVAIEALEQPEYSTLKNKRLQDFLRAKVDEQERHNDFAIATDSVRAWIDIWEDENDLQMTTDRLNPAPVYHYLPEVPLDGEWVIGYCQVRGDVFNTRCYYFNGTWFDDGGHQIHPIYAWTRIPPKPPVKPKEEQP